MTWFGNAGGDRGNLKPSSAISSNYVLCDDQKLIDDES